jgi:rhomboid protease GluP
VADPVDPDFPEGMDPRLIAQYKAQQAVWRKLAQGVRRPWMTTALLVIIGVAHLLAGVLTYAVGQANLAGVIVASRPTGVLVKLGAMYATEVSAGEKWRLVSCLFLHGDGMHLLLNGIALYGLGRLCESVYGSTRFLWLFLVAGLCGSTLSWLGGTVGSVGASGSIFGLMGACIVFGWRYKFVLPPHIGNMFRKKLLPWVFLNLAIGVFVPFIDNLGHVGGLIGGVVMAMILSNRVVPSEPNLLSSRISMGVASGFLMVGALVGLLLSWLT